jgi:hypothetical protein
MSTEKKNAPPRQPRPLFDKMTPREQLGWMVAAAVVPAYLWVMNFLVLDLPSCR